MKLRISLFILCVLALLTAGTPDSTADEKVTGLDKAVILIMRHAEKPDAGRGLSSAGEVRAVACTSFFGNLAIDGQPLKLDHIFATRDTRNSRRPRLTVEPTAKVFGLTIDDRFKNRQFPDLVNEIKSWPHGENVLISWHHGKIPRLLRSLGADPQKLLPNGKWPEDAFGWLIQLRYDQNGQLFESKRIDACPLSNR